MKIKYDVYAGNDYGKGVIPDKEPRLHKYPSFQSAKSVAEEISKDYVMDIGDYIHIDRCEGQNRRTVGIITHNKRQFATAP